MSFSLSRVVLSSLTIALLAWSANAQTIAKQKGPARVVGQFQFFCLKHLPDLDGIERAAGFGEYDQLHGEDLAPYVPDTPYEKFFGWRYHDHSEEFILTAKRGKPDDAFKSAVPAYASSTETSCSLRAPNGKPDVLLGELTRAVGRPPEKTWQDGATRVYSWTHQAPRALSYIQLYVPDNAGAKAMLNASVYVNK
jgi:hypothetical protein